jgi:AraC-like DNA-binding protein
MPALLTTESVAPGDRVDWWRERALDLFGAEYRIEPQRQAPFQMGLALGSAEPLALMKVCGSAHRALRHGEPDTARIVVHLQVEGQCTVRAEGRETLLGPGSMTLHRVRESTALHFHTAYRQVCAVLPESALGPESADWPLQAGAAIATASGTAAVLADHLRSLASHPGVLAQTGAAALTALTVGLVGATLHTLKGGEARSASAGLRVFHLERIKRFALLHLRNPALDVDFIAQGVGLSPRYLHRLFKGEPQPLMRWVLKERLERCRAELERGPGGRSISAVAYAWGFNDHAHFTHSFRRHYGMSPREARGLISAPRQPE